MKIIMLIIMQLILTSLVFSAPEDEFLQQGKDFLAQGDKDFNRLGYSAAATYKKAIIPFKRAIALNSQNPESYKGLGIAYLLSGSYEGGAIFNVMCESISALRKAYEIKPDAESYFYLGLAYLAIDDKKNAQDVYVHLKTLNSHLADTLASKITSDKVLVEKSKRLMTLLKNGVPIKTYKIALGSHPIGPKERAGDEKTPEGIYFLDFRSTNSKFYKSLHISYPNADDLSKARKHGIISPGSDVMIHGIPKGFEDVGEFHAVKDWTRGCIAVSNREIDEIFRILPENTAVPIEIRP